MVKNNLKEKKADKLNRRSAIDLLINRSMIVFVLSVAGVTVMLNASKSISNQASFITYFLPVLLVLSAVSLAGAVVFFVLRTRRGTDESGRIFTGANVLGGAIAFFGAMAVYRLTFEAMLTIIIIIGFCLAYFVACFMRRDFLFVTGFTVAGVYLRVFGALSDKHAFVSSIAAAALGAAAILLGILLACRKGELKVGARKLTIGNGFVPLIIVGLLLIAGSVLGFIGMSSFIVYILAALIATYLATLVVYAIRMM